MVVGTLHRQAWTDYVRTQIVVFKLPWLWLFDSISNCKLQIIKPVSAEPAALGMLITWRLTNAETQRIFVAYDLNKGFSMSFQAHVSPAWPFKRESFLKDDTRRDHDNLKDARVHSRLIPPAPSCITNPIVLKPPHCSNYLQNLTILHHHWLSSYCECVWPSSRNVDIPRLQASVSSKGCRSTVFRFQRLLTVMLNIEYWTGNITKCLMEFNSIEKKINQQSLHVAAGQRSQLLHLSVWFACGKYQKQGMACQM